MSLTQTKRIPRHRSKPRRGPLKDAKYLAFVRTIPCVVCILPWRIEKSGVSYSNVQESSTESAHVGERGLGQKCSDRETIPLCSAHHRTGRDSHHILGKGFFAHHGLDKEKIIAELNRLYDVENRDKVVSK